MNLVILFLISLLTIIIIYVQVADTHRQAYDDAITTFQQIGQVLELWLPATDSGSALSSRYAGSPCK